MRVVGSESFIFEYIKGKFDEVKRKINGCRGS